MWPVRGVASAVRPLSGNNKVYPPPPPPPFIDYGNNKVRRVTLPEGVVTTIAGTGYGNQWDGRTFAGLSFPHSAVLDAAGAVWVGEGGNNAIRRIVCPPLTPSPTLGASASPVPLLSRTPTPSSTAAAGAQCVVSTLAGVFAPEYYGSFYADGRGSGARLSSPTGLALDATGAYLYVSEATHRIRRIETTTGVVTTFCGSGVPAWADGQGTQASFRVPRHMTIDASGVLYVADSGACGWGGGWTANSASNFGS